MEITPSDLLIITLIADIVGIAYLATRTEEWWLKFEKGE
jgi:hypothetical protein